MNFILFFVFCHVAFCDMTKRKIYNYSVVIIFFLSILTLLFFDKVWISSGWIDSSLAFIVYSILFASFYAVKWMGAGDVKLGAVLAFLFGVEKFFWVWIFSIIFTLIYAGLERLCRVLAWEEFRIKLTSNSIGSKYIPYGAFLCIASMLVILKSEAGL